MASASAGEALARLGCSAALSSTLAYLSLGCCGVLPGELNYGIMLGLHKHMSDGAYYPRGGPSLIARGLVRELEKAGGRCFVRARVEKIITENGQVKGVQLVKNSTVIEAPLVLSTAGLHVTTEKLLDTQVPPGLQHQISQLERTAGHIFGFIGLRGDTSTLQLPRRNTWLLPCASSVESGMKDFQQDMSCPFGYVGIAFPSAKDLSCSERHPGHSTCAILCGDVPYEWFSEWDGSRIHHRGAAYEKLKSSLQERLVAMIEERFPQVQDKVDYVDVGTPLDTQYYLAKERGESYGLRLSTKKAQADATWLLPKIEGMPSGLYFAGQDLNSDGFAPSLLSGIMCVAAIEGPQYWLTLPLMLGGWAKTAQILVSPNSVLRHKAV